MKWYEAKRFTDLWCGDPAFREMLQSSHGSTRLDDWLLPYSTGLFRPLFDENFAKNVRPEDVDPAIHEYREHWLNRSEEQDKCHEEIRSENPYFQQWRQLQIARLRTQLVLKNWERLGHFPFAFELCRGCSVGCDYCAVGAAGLNGVARFTSENETMYRELLEVLADFFGSAAPHGFLYWATEPLDNLDYRHYLHGFYEQFGLTPSTTTAAWFRNFKRTREFLQQSEKENGCSNRFSINSLEHFRLCMQEFSPSELQNVELVFLYSEALQPQYLIRQANATEAPQVTPKWAAGRGSEADPNAITGTIACVSGFVINLFDKTVMLCSPCSDLERWPLGYAVYKQGSFEDADGLKQFIAECETEIFAQTFNDQYRPQFRDDLQVEVDLGGQVALTTQFKKTVFKSNELLRRIVGQIDGGNSIGDIVERLESHHDASRIRRFLHILYERGFFEHLPEPEKQNELEMVWRQTG